MTPPYRTQTWRYSNSFAYNLDKCRDGGCLMGKRTFALSIVVVTLLSLSVTPVFAADMLAGKWRVNTGTTNTQEIISAVNGIRVVADSVGATGIKEHREFTVQFDSKDYPFKQTLDGKPITDGNDMVSA